MFALDAAGHPDPQTCKDSGALFVGQYVGTRYQQYGTTRGYVDSCLAIGLGVLLIFEEWASQFLGGYDDGRALIDRMRMQWDYLSVPNDGTVIPAVALVDPNPGAVAGHEQELIEFARGINEEMWLPEWTGYGSKYGLDVVRDSGVAPKLIRRWGVGTWGFGERPDGSLPANVDADMIQHGNVASPVTGTDFNTVFRADMGQWGGPTTGDDDLTSDEQAMLITVYNVCARLVGVVPQDFPRTMDLHDGPLLLEDAVLPGGSGGLSEAQVRTIVREELNQTRLAAP